MAPMDIREIRLANLRTLVEEAGSAATLAEKSGTAASYISQLINETPTKSGEKRGLGSQLARRFENAMHKAPGWMDWQNEPSSVREAPASYHVARAEDPQENVVHVPHYNVHPSAGDGSITGMESIVSTMGLDERWLRQVVGVDPQHAALLQPRGDSMAPTIIDSELILVDTSKRDAADGVFVIRVEGRVMIKRLQVLPGAIRVLSDNKLYDPFDIDSRNGADFAILASVRWAWRGQRL